jgi:ABC-type oligopeptide transport system ATPase subunit
MVVLGESGCGKSSLAKALLRLLAPQRTDLLGQCHHRRYVDVMKMNEETLSQTSALGEDVDGAASRHERA